MAYSTQGVGLGEISIRLADISKNDYPALETTVTAYSGLVRGSVKISDGYLIARVDFGQLTGEKRTRYIKKIHDSLCDACQHKATSKKPGSPSSYTNRTGATKVATRT